jgi:methyl-accepting chemotaxis protein
MRVTIKSLLGSLFAIIFVVVAAVAIHASLALKAIDDGLAQVGEKRAPALIMLGQMNSDIGDVRDAQSRIVFSSSARREAAKVDLAAARQRVGAGLEKYGPTMVDDGDRELFQKFTDLWSASEARWRETAETLDAGRKEAAEDLFLGPSKQAYDAANDGIQKAVDDIAGNVRDEISDARRAVSLDRSISLVGALMAVLAIAAGVFIAFARVAKPIHDRAARRRNRRHGAQRARVPEDRAGQR